MTKPRAVLFVLLALSLIPALILAWERISFERAYDTVGVVIDYPDARSKALENGLTDEQYLRQLKGLGVDGVAVYEDNLSRLSQDDKVVYRSGADWRNDRRSLGQSLEGIDPGKFYVRSVQPGAAEAFAAKYRYPTERVTIDGDSWIAFPVDVRSLLAGPDLKQIKALEALGFFVVYRPQNALPAVDPGADFPEVPYVVYAGDEVTGFGDDRKLELVRERTMDTITGLVENTDLKGAEVIAKTNPIVRVFSLRKEWQDVLQPEEVASKFVLAARERNHRLLYVRPFNRLDQTALFLAKVNEGLARAGLKHGPPAALEYQPDPLPRLLSLAGPLIALLLLATAYPWVRLGALVAVAVLGLSLAGGGLGFDGAALLAACVFPALGFALYRSGPRDWLWATAITVAGGLFVAALGTGREEVLALAPFRGVALTLVLPPLLLALSMLPRQDVRRTLRDLWNAPVSLGTLGLAGLGLAAVALVVLRRGNTPAVGVSATESKVRAALQDSLIRPRTKEVILHPAAILGLAGGWPTWFANLLLLAGVIGQGSIVDSFAHYHTPLLITLLRTANGLAFGGVLGLVLLPLAWWVRRLFSAGGRAGAGRGEPVRA